MCASHVAFSTPRHRNFSVQFLTNSSQVAPVTRDPPTSAGSPGVAPVLGLQVLLLAPKSRAATYFNGPILVLCQAKHIVDGSMSGRRSSVTLSESEDGKEESTKTSGLGGLPLTRGGLATKPWPGLQLLELLRLLRQKRLTKGTQVYIGLSHSNRDLSTIKVVL